MSQYKPHLMKGPYLLFLITASAVGVLLLFTAQLGGTRGSSRWLLRGLEKTMALSLVLVAYGVGTGMMRQLDFFPNPILAHRVDGTVSMPRRDGARVTHDLLLAWATGDATVTAAEDGYVDVRWFGLNNEARPVLWMHPPSSASYSLAVPPHATLEFAPAIHPEVWLPEYGDGTVFIVRINDGEREETVFYQHVDAKNVPQDRRWHDTQVDLGIYAGQQVTVTFATEPLDSNAWDWAGWATPALLAFEPSQAFSP
jgi:hypothetical protein